MDSINQEEMTDPLIQYPVFFYHFTDRRNVESIRSLGGVWSLAALSENGVEIPAPGGNDLSHYLDNRNGLDRYVHLCFRDYHPMAESALRKGWIVDAVFLQIAPDILQTRGLIFTAGVSNKTGVEVVPLTTEASRIGVWKILSTPPEWGDPSYKYELLVPNHVPMNFIRNLPHG